jgi:GT2 family glycosyltransferase
MNYSIAIRTLGQSGENFVRELESIKRQTIQPEKVIIYIAEGYKRPEFTIGKEEYVWVKKGMVAQRALRYDEISSPLILLLDDDVELEPTCAEVMINSLESYGLDCLAAETYQDHLLPIYKKIYAAITNLVFPHWSNKWAFKIHSNGSFSYNINITKDLYLSESAAGPAALWKKEVFRNIHIEHEVWLDKFGFSYGDDGLTFNKLFKNGYHLGVHYSCGVNNLDAKSSSDSFQKNLKKYYTRSMASLMIWHRTCYNLRGLSILKKAWAALGFSFKTIWLFLIHIIASVFARSPKILWYYSKGIFDGLKMIHSDEYRRIPNYIVI